MNLLKWLLLVVIVNCVAGAQTKDTGTTAEARNEIFHNASTDYKDHGVSILRRFSFDTFSPIKIQGYYNLYDFNTPGYSWGNAGGWSVQHGTVERGTFNTRGIGQVYASDSVKHATGDFAAQYTYAYTDGGATAQSDEGFTLDTRQGGESDSWFRGTVATGATPGTTLLPVTYVRSPHSQDTTTDGAFMLDITKGSISGTVTGSDALVPDTSVHTMPVSVKLPPSTGIGIVDNDIPRVKVPNVPEKITLTHVRLVRGSFVAGKACLAGGWYPEQVVVTETGQAKDGLQDVTIIHKNPNKKDVNNPTSLWQGGVCGQYLSLDRNLARDGFRTSYEVVGATDSGHLAYVWNVKGSTKQNVVRVYQAPAGLKSLSRSNGVVTATFANANQSYIFNHAPEIVIADASSPSFNGAMHLPVYVDDLNRALKWSQAGPDETASSATINLPAAYFGFHLYPGAEVLGPQVAGGVPLEPNSVEWASGDVLENPHNPSFSMYGRRTLVTQNTLSSGFSSNGQLWGFYGSGISANYFPSVWVNNNPCSLYTGCGGTLEPIRWDTFFGPYLELINMRTAPLNNGTLITVGCDSRGCDHTAPYRLFTLQNGAMGYDPANSNFTVPHMTANSFSGHLDGSVTTSRIDLEDPNSPDHVLTITNSGGRVVIDAHGQPDDSRAKGSTSLPVSGRADGNIPSAVAATATPGQGGKSESVTCASGYACTASRGRLTIIAAAPLAVGIIAGVRADLPPGTICTATQNGGSSFFGIGSGKENPDGFDITAGVALRGTLTVDYSCR